MSERDFAQRNRLFYICCHRNKNVDVRVHRTAGVDLLDIGNNGGGGIDHNHNDNRGITGGGWIDG